MTATIFDSLFTRKVMKVISGFILGVCGWKVEGVLPIRAQKCVIIAVPHATAWDLPVTVMSSFLLDLHIRWFGKDSLFKKPFTSLMLWLGGISVNRHASENVVTLAIHRIRDSKEPLQLVIAPEGSRKEKLVWKTGFYYIATGAKVPIMLAYINYQRKILDLGEIFYPTGNYDADMEKIRKYYKNKE